MFVPFPSHGHVNPALPIMAELAARGERVHVVVGREFAEAPSGELSHWIGLEKSGEFTWPERGIGYAAGGPETWRCEGSGAVGNARTFRSASCQRRCKSLRSRSSTSGGDMGVDLGDAVAAPIVEQAGDRHPSRSFARHRDHPVCVCGATRCVPSADAGSARSRPRRGSMPPVDAAN